MNENIDFIVLEHDDGAGCALIAATLPNPIRFNSAKPSSYILKRQSQILRLMNLVPKFPPEEKAVEKKKSKKKKSK